MNWLNHQFSLARAFWREHLRVRVPAVLAVFLALCAVSYFVLGSMTEVQDAMLELFGEVLDGVEIDEAGHISMGFYLGNNARATAVSILLGLVPYAFLPALTLAINAVVIGAALSFTGAVGQAVGPVILWGLLPHGLFEIPALVIAGACGLWLCYNFCRLLRRREGALPIEQALPAVLRIYILYVLPLLLLAAAVESYVTPLLMIRYIG